jgi:hypothetical protein
VVAYVRRYQNTEWKRKMRLPLINGTQPENDKEKQEFNGK